MTRRVLHQLGHQEFDCPEYEFLRHTQQSGRGRSASELAPRSMVCTATTSQTLFIGSQKGSGRALRVATYNRLSLTHVVPIASAGQPLARVRRRHVAPRKESQLNLLLGDVIPGTVSATATRTRGRHEAFKTCRDN